MENNKCKICRRLGVKLFLKGERCLTAKCPMIKRPYPPGMRKKRKTRALSEYGKELREKQKLKNLYNLRERQFGKYVKEILAKKSKAKDAVALLLRVLESRFDNTIFRAGLASSRRQARQLTGYSHFLINDKPVNCPSYLLKKGDKIAVKQGSFKKVIFKDLLVSLKKYQPPSWLELDKKTLTIKVIGEPTFEEATPPCEISSIFEYYSR